MRDLAVLVPDKNTEHSVRGAFQRPAALGIRALDYQVFVESGRDPGVRRRGVQLLSSQRSSFSHALMLMDFEGSGSSLPAAGLEAQLDAALQAAWQGRAKAIVIEPEVDIWMWGAETHLREVVGWTRPVRVRTWLTQRGFHFELGGKPDRPKEALEALFYDAKRARSSAHYEELARRLSAKRCQDPAFLRLNNALKQWFGVLQF